MNHDGAAKDALGSNQLDELVRDRALCIALSVRLEVAQVTDVALRVRRGTVGLAVRVDCSCQSAILISNHPASTHSNMYGGLQ